MLPKKNLEIPLRPCVGITTKSISSCSTKSTIPLQAFLAALTWGSITWKAERGAAALQSLLKIHARVKRRGIERQIAAEELVPGDVVLLESGNRVPADLRLVQVNNLAIDESLLTGESLAVEKKTFKLSEETSISERSNMAFAGSTVN
ncbi:MAG: hypothetical protein HYW01_09505 [Deltaproteobacteria bacterium]|nr:hypothetical protein [Deltaproteobacteria bacterium]